MVIGRTHFDPTTIFNSFREDFTRYLYTPQSPKGEVKMEQTGQKHNVHYLLMSTLIIVPSTSFDFKTPFAPITS